MTLENLGLGKEVHIDALMKEPGILSIVKILLIYGLDEAAKKTGGSKKKIIAKYFKDKIERMNRLTDSVLTRLIKDAIAAMRHHRFINLNADTNASAAARVYFDKARALLNINEYYWKNFMESKYGDTDDIYAHYAKRIKNKKISDNTPLVSNSLKEPPTEDTSDEESSTG
ncbi:hypothetical protein [Piscirickettsia litoralis]|uniref:Uncharacterized protein n=1 Tax=Piscirickettsia litoralis TaxID=1891921 RepID=A0ABX3A216_9GAMM|nr:hypothetical protein [Piscirickettsia litoralis]ODN41485.1 hypothetical protein BGC07_15335 [Piscirickettsia litoralis]